MKRILPAIIKYSTKFLNLNGYLPNKTVDLQQFMRESSFKLQSV